MGHGFPRRIPRVGTESFFVQTTDGPLGERERDRATAWGRQLAATLEWTVAG